MIVKFAKILSLQVTGVGVLIFGVNKSRNGVGFRNFGAGLELESQKSDSRQQVLLKPANSGQRVLFMLQKTHQT